MKKWDAEIIKNKGHAEIINNMCHAELDASLQRWCRYVTKQQKATWKIPYQVRDDFIILIKIKKGRHAELDASLQRWCRYVKKRQKATPKTLNQVQGDFIILFRRTLFFYCHAEFIATFFPLFCAHPPLYFLLWLKIFTRAKNQPLWRKKGC